MKKKIFLILISFIMLFSGIACIGNVNNSNSIDINTEQGSEENKNQGDVIKQDDETLKSLPINKNTYKDYLRIEINEISQTSTLLYNIYYYRYFDYRGFEHSGTYTGLTPPNNVPSSAVQLTGSKYSLSTSFNIQVYPVSENYKFKDTMFRIVPRLGKSGIIDVYVDSNGNGSKTFKFSEETNTPSLSYGFNIESSIIDFKGYVIEK